MVFGSIYDGSSNRPHSSIISPLKSFIVIRFYNFFAQSIFQINDSSQPSTILLSPHNIHFSATLFHPTLRNMDEPVDKYEFSLFQADRRTARTNEQNKKKHKRTGENSLSGIIFYFHLNSARLILLFSKHQQTAKEKSKSKRKLIL